MFELLKEMEPNLKPSSIVCDFEQAAHSAMNETFPNVQNLLNLAPNRVASKWLCLTVSWRPNSRAQKAVPKRLGQIVSFRP